MRTALLFSLLLLSGVSISAQSLRDSISLKITSFIDEDNVGHYTSVQLELENHTKDFKYTLTPTGLDMDLRRYWQAVVEVECSDKARYKPLMFPVFDLGDGKRFLFPGECLVETCLLFDSDTFRKKYNGADVVRFRIHGAVTISRRRNCEEFKDLYIYRLSDIATDWVDVTTPEFDFLRK